MRDASVHACGAQGTGKWYQLEDLRVTEVLPQLIQLSEAYIQVMPDAVARSLLMHSLISAPRSSTLSPLLFDLGADLRGEPRAPQPALQPADAR